MIQIRPVSDLRNKFPDIEKAANDLLDAVEKAIEASKIDNQKNILKNKHLRE